MLISTYSLKAQESDTLDGPPQNKSVFQIRAGINLGGFSPLPLPAEIREINGFNPKFNFNLEGNYTYWFEAASWAFRTGIRIENKGMITKSKVKNYGMEIIGDEGERVAGNWTGRVLTEVANSYVTVPITAVYKLSTNWELSAGGFVSILTDKEFSGYVSDGYLREGGPTGNKIIFEGDSRASYDFSDDLRQFSYGTQVGAAFQVSEHLRVFSDFTFGLNDIFKSDFHTITFKMRPIYLSLGFGYVFI